MSKTTTFAVGELFKYTVPGEWGQDATDFVSAVPVLRSTNFRNDGTLNYDDVAHRSVPANKLTKRLIEKGDILIEKSGGSPTQPAGRVVYCAVSTGGTCSNFIEIAKVKDEFDSRFVFYLLFSLYKNGRVLRYQQQTTGIINFKLTQYKEDERVELPTSKTEQTRIATILTNLDQLITTTEARLAKQQRLRTGLLHDLLTRGLDQHGQLRSEETHEFKDSPLGRIPVEWEVKTLSQVCGVLNGFAFDSKMFTQEEGMPLIRIRDLEASTTTENYAGLYKPQYVVQKNDLLIGMDGEFNCRRWQGGPALLNQRVCKLVPIESKVDDSFLFNFIAGYLKQIEATTGATTVKHISSYQILDIEFACPDVTEQITIGQMLNLQEQLSQQQTARLAKLRRLKTGLMQDLLTGHVPVDYLDSLLPEA